MRAILALVLSTTIPIPTNGAPDRPSASVDGRYVSYDSSNGVFLHDRQTGVTEAVAPSGFYSGVSADGRFVVFMSSASDLVPGDTNGVADVFVRDRLAATVRRVSMSSNGKQGNGFSQLPRISAGGRFVVFSSAATNLVGGDHNGVRDVFVHDLVTAKTRRVTSDRDGEHDPGGISGDGRFVGYVTSVNDIGNAYVKDLRTGAIELVGVDAVEMSLSRDGRRAAYDEATGQIYVRDLVSGMVGRVTTNVSGEASSGSASHGAISPNGRFVGFVSNANDLPGGPQATNGVFVRDTFTATTFKASEGFTDWSGVGGICDAGITFAHGGALYLHLF